MASTSRRGLRHAPAAFVRQLVCVLAIVLPWSAPAGAGVHRAIDGWEDLHFGLRPPDVLRALPGSRMNPDLCDPRARRLGLGRSGERCDRVEGLVHVGYLAFDASVYFSQATGRAVRIRLVLRDPEQWSRKSYDELLRGLERSYGPAAPFFPLGASFEKHCADQVRRARLGDPVEPSALVPLHCEAAHAIEGPGGRIALGLCIREPCPGAANLLTTAAAAAVGLRVLDIELTAARAPGEPAGAESRS